MAAMGPFNKHYLVLIVVSLWQVADFSAICSETCICTSNVTTCQKCSYNLTLKESSSTFEISMCCNESDKLPTLPHKYVNKTFLEVRAYFSKACYVSNVELDLSALNINLVVIKNTSFTKIKVLAKNLNDLDLSSNKLQFLSKGLFNDFSDLRKLDLSRNEISIIYEDSFVGLNKLETLDLSENNLTALTRVFTSLANLQHLNLSRNNIAVLRASYFSNRQLQQLDVSGNDVRALAAGALQRLPALARLRLADNPRLGAVALLLGSGRRLQQLDAARCNLRAVPAAFTRAVRFLALPGNHITALRCGDLDTYPLLQSLDLSNNRVSVVEEDSLGRLEMLLFLNFNKNYLVTVPRSLPDELKYLSINSNMVKNLSQVDFKNLPNLKILLLQNNQIHYIEDHAFDDLLSLEMLDLSSNPIQMLSPSTFEGPLALRDLRLCYLNASLGGAAGVAAVGQEGAFPLAAPESVQMLHLAASPALARQLLADSAALAALSRLQYLDLRLNNLTALRNDLLFYLVQLKTLRLHGNGINCTAELWLRDWMNGNKTSTENETCYYSTSEAKPDIVKYNCTFPETFTISESLPPVNLYSTEMINKLLRYYGYLGNKTEKAFKHGNSNYDSMNDDLELKTTKDEIKKTLPEFYKTENYFQARKENKILINDYFNETSNYKSRLTSKLMDQNKLQNDQQSVDRNFLSIEQYMNSPEVEVLKTDEHSSVRKNKSGTRLNTPINTTKEVGKIEAALESKSSVTEENYTTVSNERREYSHYQAGSQAVVPVVGMTAVFMLMVVALMVWVGQRLSKRGRVLETNSDQIEVANISGGMLW